ncbi:uncharacterized protein BDZ99DRAFT_538318 [Mytilinidion resinicola]|uniref:Uncharacterized protein n=1 Tax=Mytilinidion resinicola TaxID=574789 RepID=A0A6A6YDW8_9PEZI|nr:uncharacterized protein BDZ99DRAFT_538318 [Mytilinidion resinicola]KAF2806194.1 hypothetical protein BDZ99DRAFT_538318 [Mytilinidion resinicola]
MTLRNMDFDKVRLAKLRAEAKRRERESMDDLNNGHEEAFKKLEEKEFCESAVRFFYFQKKREEERYSKKRDEIDSAWEAVLAEQGRVISEIAKLRDPGHNLNHSALDMPDVQRALAEGTKIEVAENGQGESADVAVNTPHKPALPASALKIKPYMDSVAVTTAYMYKNMGASTLGLHTRAFDNPILTESDAVRNAKRILKNETPGPASHLANYKQASSIIQETKNTKSAATVTKPRKVADADNTEEAITIPAWLSCVVEGAGGAFIEMHCPVCRANSTRIEGSREIKYFNGVGGLVRHMCRSHPGSMDFAPGPGYDRDAWLLDLFIKRVIETDELENIINRGRDFVANLVPHVMIPRGWKKSSTATDLGEIVILTAEDVDMDGNGVDEEVDGAATTKLLATPKKQHDSRGSKRRRLDMD